MLLVRSSSKKIFCTFIAAEELLCAKQNVAKTTVSTRERERFFLSLVSREPSIPYGISKPHTQTHSHTCSNKWLSLRGLAAAAAVSYRSSSCSSVASSSSTHTDNAASTGHTSPFQRRFAKAVADRYSARRDHPRSGRTHTNRASSWSGHYKAMSIHSRARS